MTTDAPRETEFKGEKTDPLAEKSFEPTALEETQFLEGVAPADDEARIDEELVGKRLDFYDVQSFLGGGAMGRVYRAWNDRLHRLCAIKIISPELARAEPERLEMFLREARSAAQLQHPNVVSVYSLGHDRGFHYIEMELVAGDSLAKRIRDHRRLDTLAATRFVHQIASALHAAHATGLLHCDVKPDNVMVANDHRAKLGDFGLARAFGGASRRKVAGTPNFMAPELFGGKEPSAASDVYALGVSYFALLTGVTPFQARSFADLHRQVLFDGAPDVRKHTADVPAKIADLVAEMLAKDPRDRPAIDGDFLAELAAFAKAMIPTEELIADGLSETEVVWQKTAPERFSFLVPLEGGRKQTVFGEVRPGVDPEQMVMSFWTPCAPETPAQYKFVLDINARLPYGAVVVGEYQGRPHFLVNSNHPRDTLDPLEIRSAVLMVAHWADYVEKMLTGGDVY